MGNEVVDALFIQGCILVKILFATIVAISLCFET